MPVKMDYYNMPMLENKIDDKKLPTALEFTSNQFDLLITGMLLYNPCLFEITLLLI